MAQTLLTQPATAESVYAEVVQALPSSEQFKLATLIMNRIPPEAVVDYSTEWSEEDLRDLDRATGMLIERRFGPEEGNYS